VMQFASYVAMTYLTLGLRRLVPALRRWRASGEPPSTEGNDDARRGEW